VATKSKRWTRADARVVVDELEASGLSIAAFAEQRTLSYERLRKWRSRFRHEASTTGPRLVELIARKPERVGGLCVRCPSGHSVELVNVELASGLKLVLTTIAGLGSC